MRKHVSFWSIFVSLTLLGACGGGSTSDGGMGDSGGGSADTGPMSLDAGTADSGSDGGFDAGGGDAAAPGCDDGVQNGDESDVDCGGGDCGPCAEGRMCGAGTDCASGSCVGGVCVAPACDDGVENGDETGPDCGGAVCDGCAEGVGCRTGDDCLSGVCDPATSTCAPSTCDDGLQNGDETDDDCGGSCPGCPDGDVCAVDDDCASGFCNPDALLCATPTCTDGMRNGAESDVDCGGSDCAGCGDGGACTAGTDCASGVCDPVTSTCSAPTCTDGVQNGAETDTDCGGGTCPACTPGGGCAGGTDCTSGVCSGTTCAMPTCMDMVRNGDETGTDCGGGTCPGCGTGLPCAAATDCLSRVCDASTSTCAAPTCTDGARNGDETGVDCGGGTCAACPDGGGCALDRDCESRVCDASSATCVAASCTDGVLNGDETGTDCGGSTCAACPDGDPCVSGTDCVSGVCDGTTLTCAVPTCSDGVTNGAETDVDCGGPDCLYCSPGEDCLLPRDCSTGVCGAGTGTCSPPTCTDGVRNGLETDVDCGGLVCPVCRLDEHCSTHGDCASGLCAAGVCRELPSCNAIHTADASLPSGAYPIRPTSDPAFIAYCDMTTDGGGWTRIARLVAGGGHELAGINRTGGFFTRAWVQGTTSYTSTSNAGVNLATGDGMLDARTLLAAASEVRYSCTDTTRSLRADGIWAASAADRTAITTSSLGSSGYALTSVPMRFSQNGAPYGSVSAYPTADNNGYWGAWHICGIGDGAGGPNTESTNGFQIGVCHNSPFSSDYGLTGGNQIAIGFHNGFTGLRLECTANTPEPTEQISGTWMAWVR